MASALTKVLKDNAKEGMDMMTKGTIGKIFGAAAIVELVTAENKLKAIGKLLKDIMLMKPMMAGLGLAMFSGMSKAVQSLVKDTGSLEQMLKKLSQIQGLQNMFTPLVGGANAAKQKVAELTNFAARFNKTLGETGEASRSLQIMTRGAFAGAQALKTVGDAAAGSGNGIVEMADTVGQLYAQLRGGNSISGTVEQLRQMGAISQGTANDLVALQQSGASMDTVFSAAKASLDEFNGSMDKAKDSVEGVNAAYEEAVTNLQEKFASPFVADDITNTNRMTSAMRAIAPTVARLGEFFNILTGGMATAKSTIIDLAANFGPLRSAIEGIAYAIGILVTVAGVLGSISLALWFGTLIPACAGLGQEIMGLAVKIAALIPASVGASNAIIGLAGALARVAPAAATAGVSLGVVFGWVSALVIVATVIIGVVGAIQKEKQALRDLNDAHDETTAAMNKQIAAMKTLQDQSDALSKSLANEAAAQEELTAAILANDTARTVAAQNALDAAKKQSGDIASKNKNSLAPSDDETQAARDKVARDKMLQEQDYQQTMQYGTPDQKIKAAKEREQRQLDVEMYGREGVAAKGRVQPKLNEADMAKRIAQQESDNASALMKKLDADIAPELKKKEQFRSLSKMEIYNREYSAASARKTTADEKLAEANKLAEPIGQGADGSVGIDWKLRALQAGKTEGILEGKETPAEAKARLTLAKEKALSMEDEYSSGTATANVKESRKAIVNAEKEKQLNEDLAAIDKKRDSLKSTGYERTKEEIALQMEALDKQIEFERSSEGGGDKATRDKLAGQKEALQTSAADAARADERSKDAVNRDYRKQRAAISGDGKAAMDLENYDAFEQGRSKAEGAGYGRADSIQVGKNFASGAIELKARESAFQTTGAITATDLARIGGGGNIGAGDDRMIDIAKAQLDMLKSIDDKMKAEDAAAGGTMKN